MRKVFKYPLTISSKFELQLPKGATILSAQIQSESPVMWAEVDPEATKTARTLYIVGTGHDVPVGARFVSTFQEMGGQLIWHLYEAASQ
jgi:hypothetical protein